MFYEEMGRSAEFQRISFCETFGTKYSRMDQVNFVKDSLEKVWRDMVYLSRPYSFKLFKGCSPQIFFGPFLNTLSQSKVSQKRFHEKYAKAFSENIDPSQNMMRRFYVLKSDKWNGARLLPSEVECTSCLRSCRMT